MLRLRRSTDHWESEFSRVSILRRMQNFDHVSFVDYQMWKNLLNSVYFAV